MLLALLINLNSAATSKAGATSAKRKNYVIEIDGSLYQYSSKAKAIQALEQARKPDVIAPSELKPAVIAPKPLAVVPITAIKEMATDRQADKVFENHLHAQNYTLLLSLYEQWQDDQDIELLLMAA